MTITFTAATLSAAEYTASVLAQPSAEPLSGDIEVRAYTPFVSEDGRIVSGSWESEPGHSRWEFLTRGEIITVVSGRMTVQRDGEEAVELSAGMTAVFPIGWTGLWTVHETFRKIFVVYND